MKANTKGKKVQSKPDLKLITKNALKVLLILVISFVIVFVGIYSVNTFQKMRKTDFENKILGTVNGDPVFGWEYFYHRVMAKYDVVNSNVKLAQEKGKNFWNSTINGKKVLDYVQEWTIMCLTSYKVQLLKAAENKIQISDAEKKSFIAQIKANEDKIKRP